MTETLQAIVNTTTYDLSDDSNYIWVQKGAAFGMPPVRRLTQQGPQQHGVTDLGFRLEPRRIGLALRINGTSEADYYTRRKNLLSVFKPSDDAIKLRVSHAGGTRQIDCHYSGALDWGQEGRSRWSHEVAVELYAPDPTWYDPTQGTTIFSLSISSHLIFPITFPILFGSGVVSSDGTIAYGGDWQEYPTVKITGPAVSPTVRNTSTDEKLSLNYTVGSGEEITFTLTPGNKTIVNNSGVNIVPYLSTDSDLATFHLAPSPEVSGGTNALRFEATNCNSNTQCQILHYNRYIGV